MEKEKAKPMNHYLSKENSIKLLQFIANSPFPQEYDAEKHRLIVKDNLNNELLYFRLPIVVPSPDNLRNDMQEAVNYIIVLIQSGSCAVGLFKNEENIDHKVFKSYMVRMKQGKSQIKYLKTKGKSKAGSRVRLGETVDFFENINERLQAYFKDYKIDRVAISCSKILIPFLYNSKTATPFNKNDSILLKIPRHIHLPNYEVLMDVHKFLSKGELIYEADDNLMIRKILEHAKELQEK